MCTCPGQVLVKAHSIGAGIPDQLVRTGRYPWMPPLPTIPGIEMSGAVAALGGIGSALLQLTNTAGPDDDRPCAQPGQSPRL